MIIYLEKSIASQMTGPHAESNILFIDQLLMADYRSDHAVFIDSKLTPIIKDQVSSNLKKWLLHIDSQTTMLAALVPYVDRVFVVTDGHNDIQALPICLREKAVFVSLTDFQKRDFTSTVLLGENLDDCEFYKLLALYYEKKHKIAGFWCHCETENGGGSTTHQAYTNTVSNNNKFCLCIVDSDMHYAGKQVAKGQTFHALNKADKKIEKQGNGTFCSLLPLQVMEVENLIPYTLLEQIFSSEPVCKDGLKILKSMVDTFPQDESNPVLFYDLKKGLRVKDCAKCVHTDLANYWRKVFDLINDATVTPYDSYDEEAFEALEKHKKEACIKKGLQQTEILPKSVRYITENYSDPRQIESLPVDKYLVTIWEKIGLAIFSWTCAAPRHSG